MIDLERTASFIRQFEGFSAKKYWDVDAWAIGYGERDPEFVKRWEKGGLTREIAYEQMKKNVQARANLIRTWMKREPTVPQHSAMASLAYNIGTGAFHTSSVLREFNEGDIQAAADAFMMWVMPGTRYEAGLRKRRSAERSWFLEREKEEGFVAIMSLSNIWSGLVVDVVGENTNNNAAICQWIPRGSKNQSIIFEDAGNGLVRVKFEHSGKYLDSPPDDIYHQGKNKLIQWEKGDPRSQLFQVVWGPNPPRGMPAGPPGWVVRNAYTGMVLDVPDGTDRRGTLLWMHELNYSAAQLFVRVPFR